MAKRIQVSCNRLLKSIVSNVGELCKCLHPPLLWQSYTKCCESVDPCKVSGMLMSLTCPVAISSRNSEGFMAISGTKPRDEK
ncbi:hypothetical protein BHE74_00008072 [Ensete ventricosum]|nr:hypothetical protein BHE74_00008072 [Ensete ventricosum]RZR89633.1 hypothetical protein BHM03_00017402 [Ensete ventricosum]